MAHDLTRREALGERVAGSLALALDCPPGWGIGIVRRGHVIVVVGNDQSRTHAVVCCWQWCSAFDAPRVWTIGDLVDIAEPTPDDEKHRAHIGMAWEQVR